MSKKENADQDWHKKKEELKLKFISITNKYAMFEILDQRNISEKLRLQFAKNKAALCKSIASL